MTDTTTLAPSDAEIEVLAVEHEAFGFGLADKTGLSTHGFDPDGLASFVHTVLAKWGAPSITCKSEQKRLATLWGFVPAETGDLGSDTAGKLRETTYNLGWASGWDAYARAHPPEKPVAVPAEIKPDAWAATNAEGDVEALSMNQSRRFDIPLYTASQAFVMARMAGLQRRGN